MNKESESETGKQARRLTDGHVDKQISIWTVEKNRQADSQTDMQKD